MAATEKLTHTAAEVDEAIDGVETLSQALGTRLSMKKLWENASPSSEFAEQTVSLNLIDYDIIAVNLTNGGLFYVMRVTPLRACLPLIDTYLYTYVRGISLNNNGVVFSNCLLSGTDKTNAVVNTILKPLSMYGIKGVQ